MLGDENHFKEELPKIVKKASFTATIGSILLFIIVVAEGNFLWGVVTLISSNIIMKITYVISYMALEGYDHGLFLQGYGSDFIQSVMVNGITIVIGGGLSLIVAAVGF